MRIYVDKIENRSTFKIKTRHYLKLPTPETMKLLVHCNIVNYNYQQNSRVLSTIVPNRSFGQLLNISLKNFILLIQKFHILTYCLPIKILKC